MDCQADRHDAIGSKVSEGFSKLSIGLMIGAALLTAIMAGGCTKNASSEWAQTAPVIKADAGTAATFGLTLRGS